MSTSGTDGQLAYGVQDAAKLLGISWDSFHDHVAPHVKWVRLGRKKIVSRKELERFLRENEELTLR
jgi:hypothetical protein